ESGPPLVKKYIDVSESDYRAVSSIHQNSGVVLKNKVDCVPSLRQVDPFGLENFLVSYSENKKRRWEIMSAFCEDIQSLQDPANAVRVSAARYFRTGSKRSLFGKHFLDLNGNINFNNLLDVMEVHTVSESELEIHRCAKVSSYKSLISKPNPPKRKRRRRPTSVTVEEDQNNNQSDVNSKKEEIPLWESKVHIIYCENAENLSKRRVNMNGKLRKSSPGPEGNNIKRMHRARRSILSFELDLDGLSGKENDFGVERRDEAGICSLSEDTAGNVCHTNVPLTEFIVQVDRRRMRSKRRHESSVIGLDKWSTIEVEQSTSKYSYEADEEFGDESKFDLDNLQQLDSSNVVVSQSLLNEVVLKAALPVDGLFPTTFAIRIYDDFENNEKLKLPNKFRGVLLIQKLEDRRKNAVL
ncbi:unnamed protein product, partial [Enterobius vermicularis]|uniref:DUF4210 domain-containing protein n=1 Tax=Enterobius vermicularis TaxID=51028 RepID=A0A0N4UTN7_ENTVE